MARAASARREELERPDPDPRGVAVCYTPDPGSSLDARAEDAAAGLRQA